MLLKRIRPTGPVRRISPVKRDQAITDEGPTIFLSSNGDLYALNQVGYKSVQVEVALRSMVSESLLSGADRYVDLADIRTEIQKP
jgi:uncharacterized LabA/DUF88 family protein